jgi:hypothetical protein
MPAVGFLGYIGTTGDTWGGLQLPFDLTPFGAPGCALATSVDLSLPLIENNGAYTWPSVPIPNDPRLIGGNFYEQGLFIDLTANALGIVMGWSSKWTIGGVSAARLYQYSENGYQMPGPTSGFITTTATIARFTY